LVLLLNSPIRCDYRFDNRSWWWFPLPQDLRDRCRLLRQVTSIHRLLIRVENVTCLDSLQRLSIGILRATCVSAQKTWPFGQLCCRSPVRFRWASASNWVVVSPLELLKPWVRSRWDSPSCLCGPVWLRRCLCERSCL